MGLGVGGSHNPNAWMATGQVLVCKLQSSKRDWSDKDFNCLIIYVVFSPYVCVTELGWRKRKR